MVANHGNLVLADIGHFDHLAPFVFSLPASVPYCLSSFCSFRMLLWVIFGGVEPSRSGRNAEEFETCKGLRGVWERGLGAEGHARMHTPEKKTPLVYVAALDGRWENRQRHPKALKDTPRNGRNCSIGKKRGSKG